MKLALVPADLISQRRRVRRAARTVRRDKVEMSLAYERFKHDVIASPAGLATFAALGFCFGRARGRPPEQRSLLGRLGSLATLALWARRMTAPVPTDAATADPMAAGTATAGKATPGPAPAGSA